MAKKKKKTTETKKTKKKSSSKKKKVTKTPPKRVEVISLENYLKDNPEHKAIANSNMSAFKLRRLDKINLPKNTWDSFFIKT